MAIGQLWSPCRAVLGRQLARKLLLESIRNGSSRQFSHQIENVVFFTECDHAQTPIEPALADKRQTIGYASIFAFAPEYPHSPKIQAMALRVIRILLDIKALASASPSP